jgi:hypothetical protein
MGISVRVTVGNKHVVIIMLKLYSKRETAVKTTVFSFKIGRVVTYIVAITIPADILGTGVLL